jgi:hypothetical protein
MTYAIDFDGTLCLHAFPEIGEQEERHKTVMDFAIRKKKEGHTVILWTCRTNGTNNRNYLDEAVDWCRLKGLEFTYVNENPEGMFGDGSRKIIADVYIDDKVISVFTPNLSHLLDQI